MKTCDTRLSPCLHLFLHIIRNRKRSIEGMRYIPTWINFLFLVGVWLILFLLRWRPTSTNLSGSPQSFWPSRRVLSAMDQFHSGHLGAISLNRVTQRSIMRFHCFGPARSWCWCSLTGQSPRRNTSFYHFSVVSSSHLSPANPHGFCHPLADSNTSIHGPDVDSYSWHLDCISISDDWLQPQEGISLHSRLSMVVNDWVVDIEWLLL